MGSAIFVSLSFTSFFRQPYIKKKKIIFPGPSTSSAAKQTRPIQYKFLSSEQRRQLLVPLLQRRPQCESCPFSTSAYSSDSHLLGVLHKFRSVSRCSCGQLDRSLKPLRGERWFLYLAKQNHRTERVWLKEIFIFIFFSIRFSHLIFFLRRSDSAATFNTCVLKYIPNKGFRFSLWLDPWNCHSCGG